MPGGGRPQEQHHKKHIRSHKHETGKMNLEKKVQREQDIAKALAQYNDQEHLRGETLPEQVYRVKVVTALIRAGIPLSKLDSFSDIFEENAYRLSDSRHMFDLVPFILKEEESRMCNEIAGKHLSVIFEMCVGVIMSHFASVFVVGMYRVLQLKVLGM